MRLLTRATLALLTVLAVVPARATAQSSETAYAGTHSGGGTIQFTVSSAGTRLTSLAIDGVAGGGCTWDFLDLNTWGGAVEIRDNAFSATSADGDTFAGTFPSPFQASGTVQVTEPAGGCTSGPLTWSATAPEPARAWQLTESPADPPPGAVSPAPALGVRGAPFCRHGQRPNLLSRLSRLRARLGDTMGVPLECEHLNNANGDTVQRTTTGLAYIRWASSLPTFTDGWRHWALDGERLIYWEGESPDPPEALSP